ncbi:hypothetical protein P4O66_013572, partial [Electrophorus voltai]
VVESWDQLPEQSSSYFLGSLGHLPTLSEAACPHMGAHSPERHSSTQLVADGFESLQLEFQDSRLSPTLTLFPQGKPFIFSESSLLHQTDSEFVPLRGSPDLSIASERCPQLSHMHVDGESGLPNTSHEQASLSQHPLGETAVISKDYDSCCSLSQHSLSPESHYQVAQVHDEPGSGLENKSERQMEREAHMDADLDRGETAVCTLSGGAPACSLLELAGEKDVGIAGSTTVSSASETALSQTGAVLNQLISPQCQSENYVLTNKQASNNAWVEEQQSRPAGSRVQPQGQSSQINTVGRVTMSSSPHTSVMSNITVHSSSMHPDHIFDPTQRVLQSYSHSDGTVSTMGNRNQTGKTDTPNALYDTPASGGVVCAAGLQRPRWSPGSQTAADGSFLTSQPVSQSTPAVFTARSTPALTPLSPVYSYQDTMASAAMSALGSNGSAKPSQMLVLNLSTTDRKTLPGGSLDALQAHTKSHILPFNREVPCDQEAPSTELDEPSSSCERIPPYPHTLDTLPPASDGELKNQMSMQSVGRVCSLPSLSYVQKVDAWKAGHDHYDHVASQGFDGIRPQKKVQNAVSEAQSCILAQQSAQYQSETVSASNISTEDSQTGVGSSRCGDVVEAGGGAGPASASPLVFSHSSLSTVVTSIQQDGAQHNLPFQLAHSNDISPGLGSAGAELARLTGGASELSLSYGSAAGPVKPSPFFGPDTFSNLSPNPNMSSTLSSSRGSYHCEQNLGASVDAASSVVSLEVDNYAPYWTSRPSSPPQAFELNIDDRIPLYLHNLGIDQSPSTILNPFALRGPIREPEFSPTDLCTIKGSVGTPTKSAQPSEGDSPQKETFSSSSMLSTDSSGSLTQRLAVQKPDRPASQGSVRMVRSQAHTPPEHQTPTCPFSVSHESDTPQREGSYGQLSSMSVLPHEALLEVKESNSSLVGSRTLQEIRHLLRHAGNLVSGDSSLASSPGSHSFSESDASFLSLRQNTQLFYDDSSLSVGGKVSLLLARSSSDSALKESSSSSFGLLQLSSQTDHITTEPSTPSQNTQENHKSRDLRVAPRRAEPEGCSAADPDKMGPLTLTLVQGNSPAASEDHLHSQESAQSSGVNSPENSPTHSPTEVELGVLSDGSSEGSMAAKVAKLLQSESPVSVITSRPSTSDPEESRAREWIFMKASGQKCEAIKLNAEDRKRIDEIKRELLLYTKHTKWSSDSEGSSQSSVLPQPVVGSAAMRSVETQLSEQLWRANRIPLDSTVEPPIALQDGLEARVRQIALREGITGPAPHTSITIATIRQTPSPQHETHCLHVHDDLAGTVSEQERSCSPTHTALRSAANEGREQGLVGNGGTEMERKGIMVEDKKRNREDKHHETKRTDPSAIQEVALKDVPSRQEMPPSLVFSSVPSDPPHISHIHLTISPKPQQSTSQRPQLHAVDACNELQTDTRINQTDRMCSQDTLRSSGTCAEEYASVPSEISSNKGSNTGQGTTTGTVSSYSQISSRYRQTFTPHTRLAGPERLLSVHAAPVPTLLPYKPQGSSELFYMPQTDAELSHFRSDTSIESSHPGSDDAVPPRFTAEVLGSREIEDRNITPKHKEGIYSKRVKMKRESTSPGRGLCISKTSACNESNTVTVHTTSVGFDMNQGAMVCAEEEEFVPLHMEADYSTDDLHHRSLMGQMQNLAADTLPMSVREEEQGVKTQDCVVEIGSSLDQLWHRFSLRSSLQEDWPANKGEVSLLERLERLSRLLHSSSPLRMTAKEACGQEERSKSSRRVQELRQTKGQEATKRGEEEERSKGRVLPKTSCEDEPSRTNHTIEEDGQENAYRCPAERDESTSVSTETTSSQSTINTQRLLRAFGPHRVSSGASEVTRGQTSSSLLRLYNTINKQKRELGSGIAEHPLSAATEIISTDDSTASSGPLSSSKTRILHSQRGTTRSFSAKRSKVKLVSKGIQAGDLEIVVNGTRRHTRDVGTTFPSPGSGRETRVPLPEQQASIPGPAVSNTVPIQPHTMLKREGHNKSNQIRCPNGVSWFVSASELKQASQKENEPQAKVLWPAGPAWFEPYSRTHPWKDPLRDPLRERHIQVEQEKPPEPKALAETKSSKPSALVPLSLQEALELHRPEFVSRSRERMKRLCLVVEERKMQAVFNQERDELFNHPAPTQLPTAVPATLPSKRVIPVREMVQRSKRIYAQLPEVQKRREEESRKAEYRTYRLNAQLFNKVKLPTMCWEEEHLGSNHINL